MKRIFGVIFFLMFLVGCGNAEQDLDVALKFRQKLLNGNGCQFTGEITADYGNVIYQFSMDCQGDKQGNLSFVVTAPDSISGITGAVMDMGGHLTFEGTALAFAPIADGQVTPVTAPWLFLKTLRSGYIVASAKENGGTYLQIDDSYHERALHLDIWLDANGMPIRGEILWDGKRVLSISVKDFTIL
ncbi:MAG: hypothetical protein E7461_01400 [Ruminococcaceae bacterium]|nr:hypothetical protein [Oscillospiraceae bacterium]